MPSSITLTVKNLPSSTSFFLSGLQPLNYIYKGKVQNAVGFGLRDSPPDFWISQEIPGVPAGAAHVAFPATSQRNVQDFFVAAMKAGGKCHGEPPLRDQASGYYSAAVIDLDGNSIEAVYRPDLIESDSDRSRANSASSAGSTASKLRGDVNVRAAPTVVSKTTTIRPRSSTPTETAPTSASRSSPTHVSKAPTSTSRSPTSAPQPQPQTYTHTAPTGEVITSIFTEARNTINVARDLVNVARPALDKSSNSTPNLPTSSNSHQPSDTIVGTLLGVAAGAALHYAYSKATDSKPSEQLERPPARIARTSTEPYEAQRSYRYHGSESPSEYTTTVRSQRYITMQYPDERLSEVVPTTAVSSRRPRRRSSFSEFDARSFTSQSRANQKDVGPSSRQIEAPPTSFRALAASTHTSTQSRNSSESRRGSVSRAASLSSTSRRSRREGEKNDAGSDVRTVIPAKPKRGSVASKATTTVKADQIPLPPSRAGSNVSRSVGSDYHSTHSRANKTVIGKMIERDRMEGGKGLTKSVVGKIEDACKVDVTNREIDPSDSVSQVSSSHARRSRRAK